MRYMFQFENEAQNVRFNRERLLLAAIQEPEQLYYMLDTQYEGIYQAEALERRRRYGPNTYAHLLRPSRFKLLPQLPQTVKSVFGLLAEQKTAVFRRGAHFYTEISHEDLVPGDVIFIFRGDVIPADLRILFSKELVVDQGIYPESGVRVPKSPVYAAGAKVPELLTEIPDLCFAATRVVDGLARAVVVSTGPATYLSHLLRE